MYEAIINKWDGSIVNDPRDPRENSCRSSINFDTLTNPYKMTPYRDSESGDSAASTSQKQNFCVALRTGSTYSLYSLGVVSGTGRAEVLYKNLTTGAGTDLDDNGWSTPSNNQSSAGATNFNLFVYYKRTGLIYGARAGTHVWAFSPSGSSWADSHQSLTYTNIAQGLVHPKDDILYVPYDNKIASNNNGTWDTAALTLPTHLYITSIADYGNYLAIGASPLSGVGNSRVYLWDRDTSLTTLSENIDWGEGVLKVLEEVEGRLMGISVSGSSSTRTKERIIFREYAAFGARKFMELQSTSTVQLLIAKQKIDNRLHFMMQLTLNGTERSGVWSVGNDGIRHENLVDNDTVSSSDVLKGFYKIGDYTFISYINSSANYALTKTDDQENYTASAIRETTINPGMAREHRTVKKQLTAVALGCESLPSGGQIVLEYRVDAGSWVTIFTQTTAGTIVTESKYDSDKHNFNSGREYEFRITSTGGAEPTELKYKYDVMKSKY